MLSARVSKSYCNFVFNVVATNGCTYSSLSIAYIGRKLLGLEQPDADGPGG